MFEPFEERPFAAASIGQLHRARLRAGGVWVAVKVQRPHIRAVVERDLAFLPGRWLWALTLCFFPVRETVWARRTR